MVTGKNGEKNKTKNRKWQKFEEMKKNFLSGK